MDRWELASVEPPGNDGTQLLLADAGMLAGYRRAHPSLEQMDAAAADLRAGSDVKVVILADAALKRDLPASEQELFEVYRANGTVVCAAAGTAGGHTGFMRAAAARAVTKGAFASVLVLTARDLGKGGWELVRLAQVDGHWQLASSTPTRAA